MKIFDLFWLAALTLGTAVISLAWATGIDKPATLGALLWAEAGLCISWNWVSRGLDSVAIQKVVQS